MEWVWTLTLNAGLWLSASLVARYGFRQPRGGPRGLATAVLAWSWLTLGLELHGSVGLLSRGPLLGWVLVGLAGGLGCLTLRRTERLESLGHGVKWGWEGAVALGLVLWVTSGLIAPSLAQPVKVVSDGPIYHLYFAVRWWKAAGLELVATPFGENAATYFPAVGDLWFTWLIVGWGGDRLARVGQAPFLLLAGVTAYALCRRLGAGGRSSLIAVCWFVTSTPLLLFTFEPNVDTVFVAADLLGVYFLVRYALGDDGVGSLVLAGLSLGLAMGTKAVGVVFVPPLILAALVTVWRV